MVLVMGTRYSNLEIAKAGLCTEGAVRNARKDGRLDDNDPASVGMFVLQMRMKAEGWGFMPDAVGDLMSSGAIVKGSELGEKPEGLEYEPDYSQVEGEW